MDVAVLSKVCKSCGQKHLFCDPTDALMAVNGTYEFTCPVTNEVATLRPAAANNVKKSCPKGSVTVKRIDFKKTR